MQKKECILVPHLNILLFLRAIRKIGLRREKKEHVRPMMSIIWITCPHPPNRLVHVLHSISLLEGGNALLLPTVRRRSNDANGLKKEEEKILDKYFKTYTTSPKFSKKQ
jgi:hypothetical protein